MDKRIELEDNGFPFRAKAVRFMQESYTNAIEAICKGFGDRVVLWGCNSIGGGLYSEGDVIIDGNVYHFPSGTTQKFNIVEETENAVYKNGLSKPAFFTKKVVSNSAGQYDIVTFRHIKGYTGNTGWTNVTYLPGYDTPGTGSMQYCRMGNKLIIVGVFEILPEVPQTRTIHPIATMGDYKPLSRQPAMMTAYSRVQSSATNVPDTHIFPIYGYVDTDGKLYLNNGVGGAGFFINKVGWVSAVIDLV